MTLKPIVSALLLFGSLSFQALYAQRPAFTDEALVAQPGAVASPKPYLILLYGGVGCGYSQLLVKNLHRFRDCQQAEVVLLLHEPKAIILKEMPSVPDTFRTYSNAVLNHRLRKNNDIFPQVFVFRETEQLLHVKGVKKGMMERIRKAVGCGEHPL